MTETLPQLKIPSDVAWGNDLRQLALLLALAEGAWAVALYEDERIRHMAIEHLAHALDPRSVHSVSLVGKTPDPLLLLDDVGASEEHPVVLCVYHTGSVLPLLCDYLEMRRDVMAFMPHGFVLWLTDYEYRFIMERAPNFLSRISATLHFPGRVERPADNDGGQVIGALATQSMAGDMGTSHRPHLEVQNEDQRRRLIAYHSRRVQELLQETPLSPDTAALVAESCYDLGSLHYSALPYRWEKAANAYRQAATYAEQGGRPLLQASALLWLGRSSSNKRLLELPTQVVPPPTALPANSRIPYSSNPLFIGREPELLRLATIFKGELQTNDIGRIVIITGLGGIGKTQLALEFAHRYGQYFSGGVFWLSFADAANIPAEVTACGYALNLPDYELLPFEAQITRVLQAWQESIPRLLIFDNCEDETLLYQWRPKTGGCRILVTSRRANWDPALGVDVIPLGVLCRMESLALLRKLSSSRSEDNTVLDAIATELGDLPLALHLAGAYLRYYEGRVDSELFLNQLRDKQLLEHSAMQGRFTSMSPTGHDWNVSRALSLSYNQLDPTSTIDAMALDLLSCAAYFAPGEALPRELLIDTIITGYDNKNTIMIEHALRRLTELGLLSVADEKGSLYMHRLVTAFVQQTIEDKTALDAVEQTILSVAGPMSLWSDPQLFLSLHQHLRHITDRAKEREDEQAAGLCDSLSYHLRMVGEYSAARPYLERALAIREHVLGPEHPNTAQSLNNLSTLLQAMGDLAGARPYFERALAIYERGLGPEHPDKATSLNNLGGLLYAMGDLAGARPYYERALAIREHVLGPEHPDTAMSLNNLGMLLQAMGDLARAHPYYARALAIYERVLGPEHPNTAMSLNNLGYLLYRMGELEESYSYFERALTIRERVLGPEHPDTATSLNNLGALLWAMGDLARARPYYARALAILTNRLGEEHPHTQTVRDNLGLLLSKMGEA